MPYSDVHINSDELYEDEFAIDPNEVVAVTTSENAPRKKR